MSETQSTTSLPFSLEEYRSRIKTVRERMSERSLDALLVTAPENICYLSGFTTTGYHVFQAMVVPLEAEPFMILRDIELDNVFLHSWLTQAFPLASLDRPEETLVEVLSTHLPAGSVIGYDDATTWLPPRVLSKLISNPRIKSLVPDDGIVESARAVKSSQELKYIRQAAEIADSALASGVEAMTLLQTDSDVAGRIHSELASLGSGFTGSPPYVVSGAASAASHATHNRRPLSRQDSVWLEIPASVERYHACVSRTVYPEDFRHPLAIAAFEASSLALEAMLAEARTGVTAGQVDAAGRNLVKEMGFGETWKNRAAYSIGLSYPPGLGEGHIIDIKPGDKRILQEGMVFHLIPILKIEGVGAVGCTETMVVGKDRSHSVSSLPRTLMSPSGDGTKY